MSQKMDKKIFWKTVVPKKIKNEIISAGSAAYLCAVLTVISAFIISPYAIADALVVLGLGLGIHLGKNRVCAIMITVYYIISKCILYSDGYGGKNFIMLVLFIITFVKGIKPLLSITKYGNPI